MDADPNATKIEGGAESVPTILESSAQGQPTILENSASAEVTDVAATVAATIANESARDGIVASHNLQAGMEFEGFVLEEPLRVNSAEADLWRMESKEDGRKAILKLYRFGIRPQVPIIERLRDVAEDHVVRTWQHGDAYGRAFEIQEFIQHGSMLEIMKDGALDEWTVSEITRDLTEAIAEIHSVDVLHRDIKPSNILIRAQQPLNLVLTDFGISSLTEMSLHMTSVNRTPMYSAPEALTGVVAEASDWWSLGVVILELLRGAHPFSGMMEQAVNFQLVSKGIPIADDIPEKWKTLLRGLLTRDHKRRWAEDEVRGWLSGRTDIAVAFDFESTTTAVEAKGFRSYKFKDTLYTDFDELGAAMAKNWDDAFRHVERNVVLHWFENEVGDHERAMVFHEVRTDEGLNPQQRLAVALMVISEKLPLCWRDEVVTLSYLSHHPEFSADFFTSSVPSWIHRLRDDDCFTQWKDYRSWYYQEINSIGVEYDGALAEQLLLSDPNELALMIEQTLESYSSARTSGLDELLKKTGRSHPEDALLLSCARDQFLTADEAVGMEKAAESNVLREFLERLDLSYDWGLAEDLYQVGGEVVRSRFEERVPSKDKVKHLGLRSLLSRENPTLEEMVAVAAAPVDLFEAKQAKKSNKETGILGLFRKAKTTEDVTGPEHATYKLHLGQIPEIRFSNDGSALAAGQTDLNVVLIDAERGQRTSLLVQTDSTVERLCYREDLGLMAGSVQGPDHSVRLWRCGTGEAPKILRGCSAQINSLEFSHDGAFVLAGPHNRHIRSWNVQTGEVDVSYQGHHYRVSCLKGAQTWNGFVSSSFDGGVIAWDYGVGHKKAEREEAFCVRELVLSRDELCGLSCCSTTEGPKVQFVLWSLPTLKELHVTQVRESFPANEVLVTVSRGMTHFVAASGSMVYVGSLSSGSILHRWDTRQKRVSCLALSPGGLRLATSGEDGSVKIWKLSELVNPFELESIA